MANRFDVFSVKAPRRDNNEFLTVSATPTRAGVFTYFEPDVNGKLQQVRELRHPDEVFSKDTLDSLNGIPYTIQENHVSLFTPMDARGKSYGFTLQDARKEGDHSAVSIKIIDGKEIEAVERKDSLELSNGYTCDVVKGSGEFNGEKYDAKQTNIRYNHVARVSNARGGDTCRIRLDSKGAICGIDAERIDSEEISKSNLEKSIMKDKQRELPKIEIGDFRLDAEEIEFPAEQEGVVKQLQSREKSLVKELEGVSEKLDSLNSDLEKANGSVTVLEKQNSELKESNENMIPIADINGKIKSRTKLYSIAGDLKLDMAEIEAMETEHEIMKAINIKTSQVKDEDVSKLDNEDFNAGVFAKVDLAYEKKKLDSKDNLDNHSVAFKTDGEESEFDKAKRNRRA